MSFAPSRVLVTGATGFVGRHLLPALRAAFPATELVPAARTGEPGEAEAVRAFDLMDAEGVAALVADAQRHGTCREGVTVGVDALTAELNSALAPGEQLASVEVVPWEAFPIGVTGKTLKRVFRERTEPEPVPEANRPVNLDPEEPQPCDGGLSAVPAHVLDADATPQGRVRYGGGVEGTVSRPFWPRT